MKVCHGYHLVHALAEVADRWVNPSSVRCDAMPAVIYLPRWACVYIGADAGGVVEEGVANRRGRSHFAAVWNPELNSVAFLYRLLTYALRSSTSVLPAAWLSVQHKSHTLYKAQRNVPLWSQRPSVHRKSFELRNKGFSIYP